MRRSYKKTAYCGDRKSKSKKRLANRAVRNYFKRNPEIVMNYREFKKIFDSYDICDYYWLEPNFEQWAQTQLNIWYFWHENGLTKKPCPTKKELYNHYMKYYKRK